MPAPVKPLSDSNCLLVYIEPQQSRGTSGTWTLAYDRETDTHVPLVHCRRCSGGFTLKVHTVADDGHVSPSIGCPWCGWHVYAKLSDWSDKGIKHAERAAHAERE
jgi:hypothetical protein